MFSVCIYVYVFFPLAISVKLEKGRLSVINMRQQTGFNNLSNSSNQQNDVKNIQNKTVGKRHF